MRRTWSNFASTTAKKSVNIGNLVFNFIGTTLGYWKKHDASYLYSV